MMKGEQGIDCFEIMFAFNFLNFSSATIRRSWNAVPLTPQLGHARQHFRLTHSPSPYDSASLILNNSIATSNATTNRNRNTMYSMSDDESSRSIWYPLSGGRYLDEV